MKKTVFLLLTISLLSCKNDDNINRDNPFLIDPLVNLQLDLSLPQYNSLNFPGNSIIINTQGIKGIVVYNVDNSQYVALELSDPNHAPSDCSRMSIDGIEASCPCTQDSNTYNIITGQHLSDPNLYPMQRYNAQRNGGVVTITN